MTNRAGAKANWLHIIDSLRRRTSSFGCSQPVSRMLATVLEWLTDFLTGAIMESRKAARSKAVASPPWLQQISLRALYFYTCKLEVNRDRRTHCTKCWSTEIRPQNATLTNLFCESWRTNKGKVSKDYLLSARIFLPKAKLQETE